MTTFPEYQRALTPLEIYRQEMQVNPWHFWGLSGTKVPVTSSCNDLLLKYSWQSTDNASRETLIEAIQQAELKLLPWLGYDVAPRWHEDTVLWPDHYKVGATRYPYIGTNYKFLNVRLPVGYVQDLGLETLTSLTDTAAVVYTDRDSDGLNDTFTVTYATTITDPGILALYFSSGDRWDTDNLDSSRITPVHVSISGGNAVFTGPAWLLVKPVLYEGVNAIAGLDPSAAGTFVNTVAVYQRATYTAGQTFADCQCVLNFSSRPGGSVLNAYPGLTNPSTDPSVVGYAIGRAGVQDAKLGEIMPASEIYDPVTGTWALNLFNQWVNSPDSVTVRYSAGYPLDPVTGSVQKSMAMIVSRLAAAEMARPIVACQESNREVYRWQFDLARSNSDNETYGFISRSDLDNPFGTRRGHVYAWRMVNQLALRRGIISH